MEVIRTITGDLKIEDIGITQCHEHLFIREGLSGELNSSLCMESSIKALEELKMYKKFGGKTLVDAQPIGCGRMPRLLEEVANYSGVNIIASTGFHKMIFYPKGHWIYSISKKELSQIFIEEITKGIFIQCDRIFPKDRISAKAGMIKVALDNEGLTEDYKKLHSAAIKAALVTNAPIQCHIEKISTGKELLRYYKEQGYPLSRLILAHTDRKMENLDETIYLLEEDVYVQLDTIGRFKYHNTETEIKFIKKLIENGFTKQILLGLDTTRKRLGAYGGDISLGYLLEVFSKELLNNGVTQNQLEQMLIKNPQKALAIKI